MSPFWEKSKFVLDLTDPGKSYEYFFLWHFHNASKEVFWPKKNWISCTGLKVPFWQIENYGSYESLASLENEIRMCLFLGVHNCKKTVWHDNHSFFGRRLSPLGHRDKDLCESRLTTFSSAGINPLSLEMQGHCSILSAMGYSLI